ncbi:MAG: TIGR02996 domain-containing protein [Planctomycetes bacterium]|nr:TIGR02996 domain-containing protein [Planctomycetota bacterium]
MSDEDALLSAIEAHPEEDTPRLMYADWLDEHGRPLRAEFIRVQCAVKQLEHRPADEQRRHVSLWRRQEELLDLHRRDMLGALGAELTYFDVIFDRGFVSELTVSAPVFLRHAASVRALRPTPRIRVTRGGGTSFAPLLRCPELGLVESLLVGHDPDVWSAIGEPEASAFAWCSYLGRLEVLDLAANNIGDAGLAHLAPGANLPVLSELNLSGNEITDGGVETLIGSPLWPRLRRLDLSGNPLSDAAADLLTAAARTDLEHVSLRFTNIGPDGHLRLLNRFGGRVDLF